MQCQRCLGLMAPTSYLLSVDGENGPPSAFRCLLCGNMVDPVILANRGRQDTKRGAFWRKKRGIEKKLER